MSHAPTPQWNPSVPTRTGPWDVPHSPPLFSAADYLAWEATQPERHELIDGEVFAMAGAEDRHVAVAGNLEEYLVVDLDTRDSDCYCKGADGLWVLHPFGRGEAVELASVALTVTAAQLFAEVTET
jgi:Uma2 family endonuclease